MSVGDIEMVDIKKDAVDAELKRKGWKLTMYDQQQEVSTDDGDADAMIQEYACMRVYVYRYISEGSLPGWRGW